MTIYGDHASLYLQAGWEAPLPLPEGMKFPPPDDVTGNVPMPTPMDIENWCAEAEDSNLGLRMGTVKVHGEPFEVIGLDVDDYDDKNGAQVLAALVSEHGPLPMTYRSTSRDPDNPSGIRFYLVPAGQKWRGMAGPSIEVIQRTHRYAAVWPSVISFDKGLEVDPPREYFWYDLDEQKCDAPPRVSDLPLLPEAWVKFLCKGEAGKARFVEGIDDVDYAFAWLEEHIPGYNEDPSAHMDRQTNPEKLAEESSGGAHETMVNRVHEAVQLAAEGHHGLRIGISRIRKAFFQETLGANDSEARRDLISAKLEWRRALCGEVSKLRADVEEDLIRISPVGGYTARDGEIDIEVFRDKMLKRWIERRNTIVDATEYEDSDSGRAQMFLDAFGDAVRPIRSGADEWAWWNDEIGRLVQLSKAETYGLLWAQSVQASLRAAADKLFTLAAALEEQGSSDFESTEKQAKSYLKMSVDAGNRGKIENSMSMAHVLSKNPIDPADFDTAPLTWGVGNGVLDLRAPAASKGIVDSYEGLCRKGKIADLILQHTPVTYEPNFTHPEWESYLDTFLPDLEYRRYVRKVFGYAFMGGNPERRIIFIQGGTSTGKSTIIESVQAALGDYAGTIDINSLFRSRRDAGPMPEIISAFPKRVVFASEVGQRNRLHSDVIKRLTGGDSITARALYSNTMVQRTPMFTPIIATNSMPTIEDGDAALWRRLLVLPFDTTVPLASVKSDPIKNNQEALRAVLSWLVDGLLDYFLEGIDQNLPSAVASRRKQFIAGTSSFQSFLSEKTVEGREYRCVAADLHKIYRQWAKKEEITPVMSSREFNARMRDNGFISSTKVVKRGGQPSREAVFSGLGIRKDRS